jgi:hypothetical protein
MLMINLRCCQCHHETPATEISLNLWPIVRVHTLLKCSHQELELRLHDAPNGANVADDVVPKSPQIGSSRKAPDQSRKPT